MKVTDIIANLDLKVVSGAGALSNEVTDGYVSDLLSDVMGNAREGQVWITLQTHANIIAVAALKDLAAIIIVRDYTPDATTIEKSNVENIPVLSTSMDTFTIAGRLFELLKKMKFYRADLHIHTVLSPCGDLDMSPANIVSQAALKGLEIIGITDHNTTRHCELISRLAGENGIYVMRGAEVTTKEEVHCLAFFESTDAINKFQEFLDSNLPEIFNDPALFGHQVQLDSNDKIIYEEERLLWSAISKSFEETEAFVHELNGIFIPAHVNRSKNSIYSQLGFLPDNLKADALEISGATIVSDFADSHPEIKAYPIIRSSDAHYINDIGKRFTSFWIKEPSFREITMALKSQEGRIIKAE